MSLNNEKVRLGFLPRLFGLFVSMCLMKKVENCSLAGLSELGDVASSVVLSASLTGN